MTVKFLAVVQFFGAELRLIRTVYYENASSFAMIAVVLVFNVLGAEPVLVNSTIKLSLAAIFGELHLMVAVFPLTDTDAIFRVVAAPAVSSPKKLKKQDSNKEASADFHVQILNEGFL